MRKIRRIPTILGILIILAGVAAGVLLIKEGSGWFTRAQPEIVPKQVEITNIMDNSFTVSWITDSQTNGFLQYGTEGGLSYNAPDDRDQLSGGKGNFLIHHVMVKNLSPATTYFFKINNSGQPYQVTTASTTADPAPPNDVAYGTVVNQNGSPVEGAIVYLSLTNVAPLSALTKASGSWVVPLNLARSADLTTWAFYDREASTEEIFVQGGLLGTATAVATTKYDSPLPTITLGQSFDFRKAPLLPTPTFSQALPPLSKFSLVTIINPSQGEEVNTPKPEILGTGPAGQTLTIVVNSSESFTTQVTINEDGTWSWIPPADLPPGEHTVTVSLTDGQRISRSFVILAAGLSDLPSFTATPSATITPSPMPTFTPTPTPTLAGRVSVPSTEGGVPQPGYLTPTFLFSIMGVVLMILGILSNILVRKV